MKKVISFYNRLNNHLSDIVWASQVAQWQRIHLPMQEMQRTQVQFLGQENPLEEEMVTYSMILAGKIPRVEEPDRLQFMGSQRVRHE